MNKQTNSTLRLIAGSGRSGTTWLLDVLAEANHLRPVFEPLNPRTSAVAAKHEHAYLVAGDESEDLETMFRDAATGEMLTLWTHYRTLTKRLAPRKAYFLSLSSFKSWANYWRSSGGRMLERFPQRSIPGTLVKCVRANLMLDWLHAHFDTRIVLLIRHPGAVVESQLRASIRDWNPYPLLDGYRSNPGLMEGPLQPIKGLFAEELSPAQALTLVWAVQNLVPSAQARANGYHVVFYEELLEDATAQWGGILDTLGLDAVPDAKSLEAPSEQAAARWSNEGKPAEAYSRAYGRWQERLGEEACAQIQHVLDALGVSFYNAGCPRPDVAAFARQFGLAAP